MVKEHILNKIYAAFKFDPTLSQQKAMHLLANFLVTEDERPLQLIKGYAGTGKTLLISAFISVLTELGIKSVLLAPTGRAAKVLSNSAGQPAFTIHKKIYRQKSSKDGFGGFSLDRNLHKDTLFIVDEASMISNNSFGGSLFGSGRLLDDLIEFVYGSDNCRMVLIGDTAQLPPVGLDISPALDKSHLEAFGLNVYETELTDVVRQAVNSGILHNATALRDLLSQTNELNVYPAIGYTGFNDVKKITGAELMEEINHCYEAYGEDETLIVCRTNKRANLYNTGIRNSILFREDELSSGDFILVMKNNYHWAKVGDKVGFIANGDIARVVRVKKHYELYGYRFADIVCELVDYRAIELDVRIILDSITSDGAGFSHDEQEKFMGMVMEDYTDISSTKKQFEMVRENDFYNALQIKFAYAMTCHKAQGGQWKAVFIDLGYFTEEYLGREFIRWLYTAVTRATEKLYFVNFPKEFYE